MIIVAQVKFLVLVTLKLRSHGIVCDCRRPSTVGWHGILKLIKSSDCNKSKTTSVFDAKNPVKILRLRSITQRNSMGKLGGFEKNRGLLFEALRGNLV